MNSVFSNKINRLMCIMLALVLTLGFIPTPVSADEKYDSYLVELEKYNSEKADYEAYIRELERYEYQTAEWENYDAKLEQYNRYLQYLADLDAYNEAVENYETALAAYFAYKQYADSFEKCSRRLEIVEAVINYTEGSNMYETLTGETVEAVLESEDMIAGYTVTSKQTVRDAGSATHALIDILQEYLAKDAIRDKYEHYKLNYVALKNNFAQLYSCLFELYKDNAVKFKLKQEQKDHRYCEFLCQLYTISLCLDDSTTVNRKWRISSADGWLSYDQLGGYAGLEDTNMASPEGTTFPDEAPYAEYPETPVMPDQVEEVLEPIAPSGTRPTTAPTPVADPGAQPLPPTYTVKWINYDGNELMTDTVVYGKKPAYSGSLPQKSPDAQYTYTFSGWSPAVSEVDGDAVYQAQFAQTVNKYNVTWKNYDGTVLKVDTLDYGDIPSCPTSEPIKQGNLQYTYVFSGWSPAVTAVSGDVTYTAQFDEVLNSYDVIWKNYDGTVLKSETLDYGEMPVYDGPVPEKESTAQYDYTFSGWSPAVAAVGGNVIYTAKFTEILRKYTVTWKNHDGTVLKTDTLNYGDIPHYNGTLSAEQNGSDELLVFDSWSPAISEVKQDVVYTAVFTVMTNEFTVTWNNYDGTLLEKDEKLKYGEIPEYNSDTPQKAEDIRYYYVFSGWSPEVSQILGNITYTATFNAYPKKYTVTWQNYDGTSLFYGTFEYGAHPEYSGELPVKPSDKQYSYEFSGWSPNITSVEGDVTYTAQFTNKVIEYAVIWKNYDGSVLKTDRLTYGELPSYDGQTPKKPSDERLNYSFSDWTPHIAAVDGNVVYTALFEESERTYAVVWMDGDKILQSDTLAYGTLPVFNGVAEKAATNYIKFEFVGWSPEVSKVTSDAVYIAEYLESTVYYNVEWRIGYSVISQYYEYGQTPDIPSVSEVDLFVGWDKEIASVTCDAVYNAVFRNDIFDLPKEEEASVSLMPSDSFYAVVTEKEELAIDLSGIAEIAADKGKDLIIEYQNGVQVYFPNKLAGEIISKKLHVSLIMVNTVYDFELLSASRSENTVSDEDLIFGGRVVIKDGDGNIVPLSGWQLRVPVEDGNMYGIFGYAVDNGGKDQRSYNLAQSGDYAVFVSDGNSSEFKLIRKIGIKVEKSGEGRVYFGDAEIRAGDTIKADITPAIGCKTESIEVYYQNEGEKVFVEFDFDSQTFVMPPYDVIFSIKFVKIVYTVNFYVDSELYDTKTYGYGEDIVLPKAPEKSDEDGVSYVFVGWTPEISEKVHENVDYFAKFNASTVADENYAKGDHGFNFPYMLFTIAVVFLGVTGTGVYFIVRFVKKKKKK